MTLSSQAEHSVDIDDSDRQEQQVLDTNPHLTRKETRQIVTPYAFFVSDELLGTPLARPFRRGFALSVDMLLVAMLTQVSSLVLAAVAALTFFRAGNRLKTKKRFNGVRIFLRLLVALLLFVLAMGIVDSVNDNDNNTAGSGGAYTNEDPIEDVEDTVRGAEVVAITAKYLIETSTLKKQIRQNECQPTYECVQNLGVKLFEDVLGLGINQQAIDGVINGYVAAVSDMLSEQEIAHLTNRLLQKSEAQAAMSAFDNPSLQSDVLAAKRAHSADELDDFIDDVVDEGIESTNGILGWVERVIEDLGLGFGWAAFYFSVFTAWWKGQTPGKKLMGIKVIKLDNNPLNLWESFGRYGGYGAGFATGLLGFLQVIWDPNRQAIQDKISETLVIDTRRPKVPFHKEQAI